MTQITDNQVDAIKYFIILSQRKHQQKHFIRRILMYLLDQSANLSKPVCMSVVESDELPYDVVNGLYSDYGMFMAVSGGTMLNNVVEATGSEFQFSCHFGSMDGKRLSNENQFSFREGVDKARYTFWLSPEQYDKEAEQIPFSLQAVLDTRLNLKCFDCWVDDMIENDNVKDNFKVLA